MKTTGIQILAFLAETLSIDVLSARFSFDRLSDVQKDAVLRWVLQRESTDLAAEIIPGAGEWGVLVHLYLNDPLKYMEQLRVLCARDGLSSDEIEERLQTEATLHEGIHPHSLRVQLWNDQWDFYRNVNYAAMNYLEKSIENAIRDDHARFLRMSA